MPDIVATPVRNPHSIENSSKKIFLSPIPTFVLTFGWYLHRNINILQIKTGNDLFLEWVLSVVPPKMKSCLVANSTKPKRTRKSKSKTGNTTLRNGNGQVNAIQDPIGEPPLENEQENDLNYGSENSEGNDPNEEHANSYP